jgi:hypothetical protein
MHRTTIVAILLAASGVLCSASVSTNVPLGHWSYDAIDKLIGCGLIDSAMMTTRPVSRIEMARHIAEAIENSERLHQTNKIMSAILERLKSEFRAELAGLGATDGESVRSFIKPIEDPYLRFLYAEKPPNLENQRGDTFNANSNYRVGFASRMKFFDKVAFYFHPEYGNWPLDSDRDIELIEGYGKVVMWKLEVQAGKDSLWWGPGRHGSLLMTNNIQPLKMVKISNPTPIQLPWILRGLGPFKAAWFLGELERDRPVPNAKLTGLRLNFKPRPNLEFGLSRTMIFNGSGMPGVGLMDYIEMWLPQSEQVDNNQLAGFDVSFLMPLGSWAPARSVRLYADMAGEDEAGGLPANWGKLVGLQISDIFRTGRTDLRVEYANNHHPGEPNVFYTHSLYPYTYKDRVIGHHMGTDASDLFVQLSHYLTENLILDLKCDIQTAGLSSFTNPITDQFGFDITYFASKDWQLKTGYRYEHAENHITQDNHIFQFWLIREF